ncbi:hypothetical protein JEQ12_007340 [Ovis aries]|uniref:2'-5' oligoadenylate synthase n=1 Tax=Ovis aries TaxID=9940 RepID=A0A836CV58_SHEEP|nr:hypothetical protein JEQ12_007340 [Ovis aries]
MELSDTPANFLDKFIEDHLLSNTEFRTQVKQAINTICTFLKERCFQRAPHPVRVSKVVKGGSSGKGTTLRGRSDADLVVFLTNLTSFQEQFERRGEFIKEIKRQLEACQREETFEVEFEVQERQWENPRALSFVLRSPRLNQAVEFDVLPAFDALGQLTKGYRPDSRVYVQLIQECENLRKEGEFSPCFTELQRAFLKSRPTKLKSLIRLVKHWYQLCKEQLGKPLPPQYALELLTVYAWEQGCKETAFVTAQGFQTVLELVLQYEKLCIYWEKNYNSENPIIEEYLMKQLAKPRPVILDPADPTGNVAGKDARGWQRLAQAALVWLDYACFKKRDGSPVGSWDVSLSSQQPVRAMGSWESHLYEQPSEKLEEFIQNYLRPSEDCQKDIDQSVDTICAVLQEPCQPLTVTGVAKGGSYGRRTVLRGNSDGTLVVFFRDLEQFQDQEKRQYELLGKIWAQMKHCESTLNLAAKMELQNTNRSSRVTVQLSTKQQSITFNVLPAFNPLGLGEKSSPWSYRELKRSLDMVKARPGEFSVCFTELQEKFFSNYPSKLKDLILLVKHWFQKCQEKLISSSLLPPYALELLTIYAWEQGCGAEDFNMAEGVRTVLRLIKKQKQLCVYWTVNYNFGDEIVRNILLSQLQAPRPVILDPTDPTYNVSTDNTCWLLLKQEAQNWLHSLRENESPGPSWNVLPAPLYITPGHLLDKFIKDFLQPNQTFQDQIKKALKIICSFLEENCFRHSTTKIQVIQGGSTVKGTALKTGSDASLVVFADSLKSYTSPKDESCNIIKEIHKQLEACQQQKDFEVKFEISKWKPPWVLSFTLKSKVLHESVDFDVLPAFNALGELKSGSTPSPRTYAELIYLYKPSDVFLGGEFSVCFTKLQRNFVRSLPPKLKDLIRLVKHWYKGCESKLKQKGSLPPKYALELLTIYAWEKGSGAQDFDTAEGFRTVLELVIQYQHLCVFWTVNYSFDDEILRNFLLTQIQRTRYTSSFFFLCLFTRGSDCLGLQNFRSSESLASEKRTAALNKCSLVSEHEKSAANREETRVDP